MTFYARLFPRDVLDSELRLLALDETTKLRAALVQLINANARVASVSGRTGDVVLTKADVGLGNVDNIAPADLPISTATQAALDTKRTSGEIIPQDQVANLPTDLAARVKSVNGNTPDATGNVALDMPNMASVATWPTTGVPGDVITLTSSGEWTAGRPYPSRGPRRAQCIADPDMPYGWRWLATVDTPGSQTISDGPWIVMDRFVLALTSDTTRPKAVVAATPGAVLARTAGSGAVTAGGPGVIDLTGSSGTTTDITVATIPPDLAPGVDTDVTAWATRDVEGRTGGATAQAGGTATGSTTYTLHALPSGQIVARVDLTQGGTGNLATDGALIRLNAEWWLPVFDSTLWEVP